MRHAPDARPRRRPRRAAGGGCGSFYEHYIRGPDGVPPCHARTYGDAHLAAHPDQIVTRFHLTRSDYDDGGSARSFAVTFGFALKDRQGAFTGHASCRDRGDGATCLVEGDGGAFVLAPRPDGILVSVEGRLEVEGTDGFSPDLHDSDDREFRLYVAGPEACLAGTEDDGGERDPLAPSLERAG